MRDHPQDERNPCAELEDICKDLEGEPGLPELSGVVRRLAAYLWRRDCMCDCANISDADLMVDVARADAIWSDESTG